MRGRRRAFERVPATAGRAWWVGVLLYPALAPLFVLVYGALFFGVPYLTDTPLRAAAYVPFALVSGPISLLPLALNAPDRLVLGLILGGTYGLYVIYALAFRRSQQVGDGPLRVLSVIIVLHVVSTFVFVYFSGP
jgi:hypothetical protein